jgi:hypothetical protein
MWDVLNKSPASSSRAEKADWLASLSSKGRKTVQILALANMCLSSPDRFRNLAASSPDIRPS